jgi:integrase
MKDANDAVVENVIKYGVEHAPVQISWNTLFRSYLAHSEEIGNRPTWIERQERHVKALRKTIDLTSLADPAQFDQLCKKHLKHRVAACKTIHDELSWFRSAIRWGQEVGTVKNGPVLKIPEALSKRPSRESVPISSADLHKLFSLNLPWPKRFLFTLLLETGLRITEAGSIRLAYIDFDSRSMHLPVIPGIAKRKKELSIPINEILLDSLREHIQREGITDRLFPQFRTDNFRKTELAYFKACLRRAGIQTNYNLHSFRHTFAAAWLRGGASIFHLAKYLGHSHASTTDRYAHFCQSGLREGLASKHSQLPSQQPPA